MPDSLNRRDEKFAKYDAMSSDELQQILRADASKPEGEESDTETLFYVMEVLAKRRQARNEGKSPEEALESFKQNYYTENDISSVSERTTVAFKPSSRGRWRRGLIAVAAMLALVICSSITANAMGFDLWEIIAKWTQETFHFGYAGDVDRLDEPDTNDGTPFDGLQEALNQLDIHAELVPTWIPDGFVEVDIKVYDTPKQRQLVAQYENNDKSIRIRITDYLDTHPAQIEQSDELLEVHSSNGIDYYIFDNYDMLKAVWINQNFECYISGPLSVSEIKKMIDSIGKG